MAKLSELARKVKRGISTYAKKFYGKQTLPKSFIDEYKRRNTGESHHETLNRILKKK